MTELLKFDMTDYITTKEDAIEFLDLALEENNAEFLFVVLGKIAKSEGMTKIAQELGVARESLYTSLSENGNPSFLTISKLLHLLGYTLTIREKNSGAESKSEIIERKVCVV